MAMLRSTPTRAYASPKAFVALTEEEFREILRFRPTFARRRFSVVGTLNPINLRIEPSDDGKPIVRIKQDLLKIEFSPEQMGIDTGKSLKVENLELVIGKAGLRINSDAYVDAPPAEVEVPAEPLSEPKAKPTRARARRVAAASTEPGPAAAIPEQPSPPAPVAAQPSIDTRPQVTAPELDLPEGLSEIERIRAIRQAKAQAVRARMAAAKEARRAQKAQSSQAKTPPAVEKPAQPDLFEAPREGAPEISSDLNENFDATLAQQFDQAALAISQGAFEPRFRERLRQRSQARRQEVAELISSLFKNSAALAERVDEQTRKSLGFVAIQSFLSEAFGGTRAPVVTSAAASDASAPTSNVIALTQDRRANIRLRGDIATFLRGRLGVSAAMPELLHHFPGVDVDAIEACIAALTQSGEVSRHDDGFRWVGKTVAIPGRSDPRTLLSRPSGFTGWDLLDATGLDLATLSRFLHESRNALVARGDILHFRRDTESKSKLDVAVLQWDLRSYLDEHREVSFADLREDFGDEPFLKVALVLHSLIAGSEVTCEAPGLVWAGSRVHAPTYYVVAQILRNHRQGLRLPGLRAIAVEETEGRLEAGLNYLMSLGYVARQDGRYVWLGEDEQQDSFDAPAPPAERRPRNGLHLLSFADFQQSSPEEPAPSYERSPTGITLTRYINRTLPTNRQYVAKDQMLAEIRQAGRAGITRSELFNRIAGITKATFASYLSVLMNANTVIKDGKRYRLLLA